MRRPPRRSVRRKGHRARERSRSSWSGSAARRRPRSSWRGRRKSGGESRHHGGTWASKRSRSRCPRASCSRTARYGGMESTIFVVEWPFIFATFGRRCLPVRLGTEFAPGPRSRSGRDRAAGDPGASLVSGRMVRYALSHDAERPTRAASPGVPCGRRSTPGGPHARAAGIVASAGARGARGRVAEPQRGSLRHGSRVRWRFAGKTDSPTRIPSLALDPGVLGTLGDERMHMGPDVWGDRS